MSKDYKYLDEVRRERSKDELQILKRPESRGPYSKDQLIRQAIDLNAKKFKEQAEEKGQKMSEREARQKAIQVAEHRDKRFG